MIIDKLTPEEQDELITSIGKLNLKIIVQSDLDKLVNLFDTENKLENTVFINGSEIKYKTALWNKLIQLTIDEKQTIHSLETDKGTWYYTELKEDVQGLLHNCIIQIREHGFIEILHKENPTKEVKYNKKILLTYNSIKQIIYK